MNNPIKVFLVEDSPVALNILQRVLASSKEVQVIGTANNGINALKQIPELKPDVICTDLLMGKMDGLELTKKLMATFPKPILVISDVVTDNDTEKIGQLLEAGVIDVFPKPKTGFIQDYEKQRDSLVNKLKILAGVKVFTKRNYAKIPLDNQQTSSTTQSLSEIKVNRNFTSTNYQIVAIGVSTGGPKAIQQIINKLPANFPLPIVCTQHISSGFLDSLISWLSVETPLLVKIAQIGEKPLPGTIYFAPENYHLEIDELGKFCYSAADPVNSHRPSATIMLQSFAEFYGKKTIGILLTGMGKDGVLGMQSIYQKGGLTIAQDEASSVIFGMPQEAIKLGVIQQILPVTKIADFLIRQVSDPQLNNY